MLLWMLYLFELVFSFSSDIYPAVGLLDRMVFLFLGVFLFCFVFCLFAIS